MKSYFAAALIFASAGTAHAVDFNAADFFRKAQTRSALMSPLAASSIKTRTRTPKRNGSESDALKHLLSLKQEHLDNLYAAMPAGPIPKGDSRGRAAFFPGTFLGTLSQMTKALFWQGKYSTWSGGSSSRRS